MTAEPAGSLAASLATDAVTSADIVRSIASRPAASAPKPGSIARGASTKLAQNRAGSASALSHESQDVMPGGRAAAQSASSTVLPAPADPATTVSR
jgi:type IV secretory pathway TrbL component